MWRNKNVWILLIGELIAGLGLWMGIIGNLEFMQKYIPSDFMKSVVLFLGLLAGVFFGPLAGKVIDTYSKKKVMIYAGIGRMLSVVFMFMALHFEAIIFMVFFMVSIQISAAFYFPAIQAVIPLIVKEKDLIQMNGVHMNVSTLARVAGTALAGIMLVVMEIEFLYIGSMVAYLFILITTFSLDFEEPDFDKVRSNNSSSFKDVLPVLKEVPIVISALVLTVIPMLFIGGFNLMVINISELQNDISIKGLLYTVEGLSFMIGAFFVKKITHLLPPIKLMFIFAFLISIAHLSLFFSDMKIMSLISFGLFGLGVGCFFPIAATIFQTKIAKEYHGRFFSFRNMLDRIMFQVVLLSTGLLLDTIGLQYMVLIFGVLSLSAVIYFGLRNSRQMINESQLIKEKNIV
ncbi:MFS family permease [Metabacillus crassostreae]|uniref:MFS transporter n=1 Tax=Metabacillus crassostreae TaxID=929098 RepID=UPI001959616E|nr:MFS transporter [Metabacillus crassostreae]MBM7602156.1 MFS family permease [Metabacillus crassostreae]